MKLQCNVLEYTRFLSQFCIIKLFFRIVYHSVLIEVIPLIKCTVGLYQLSLRYLAENAAVLSMERNCRERILMFGTNILHCTHLDFVFREEIVSEKMGTMLTI